MRLSPLFLIVLTVACNSEKENETSDSASDSGTTVDSYVTPEPECGNGILEDGEECDDPDSEDLCLDNCTLRVGNCHTETPWDEIAESLYEHDSNGLLPRLSGVNSDRNFEQPIPDFMLHDIMPGERLADYEIPASSCETPIFWSSDQIEIGPLVEPNGEDPDYCRVRASDIRTDDEVLYFANRAEPAKKSPVTGEPTWVTLSFPIPDGHAATELTYEINWARLMGSHPDECTADDVGEDGNCIRYALDESENWDEEIPPGLFLLWGKAEDCGGWEITGPHEPAGEMSWSNLESYSIDIPETLREVDELVVSLLVYHQYPGGCDGATCYSGRDTYDNMGFGGATLYTEASFQPNRLPPQEHPRLFGADETWVEHIAKFDNLTCSGAPDWLEGSAWGGLPNIRNNWDTFTKGGAVCLDEVPDQLIDIEYVASYFDGTAAEVFDVTRAVSLLHIIRRERACRNSAEIECYYEEGEINDLASALIEIEMPRIRDVSWNTLGFDFDLYTREPMRVYTLIADVLWDELSEDEHETILEVTGGQVDAYLEHFYEPHWSIYNGNNWTPVLAEAALYWAIVYYHEDERAPELAWRALQSLWLHRDSYLSDGVYNEGLLMYSQVSFDPLMTLSRLAGEAFGMQLESIPWEQMDGFSRWAMAAMAPDGQTIDFSDSWAKRGWGTFMPLIAHMIDGELGSVTLEPDPCFAHRFFSNKYYYHGLKDPWNVHGSLARDWPSILDQCDATDGMIPDGIEVEIWDEGGWGTIRVGQAGATEIATLDESDAPSRFKQADQVMLAISAIPNSFSHTEMDFGTFVWVAYGNRLIWDVGYGSLHSDRYETAPDYPPDQNPFAHSTLIIPEAIRDGDTSTNTSQIDGRDGTIELLTIDGRDVISLDGSNVYGQNDAEYGWLEHFTRMAVALESGTIILIDDFMVRDDRPESEVREHWYTQAYDETLDIEDCSHSQTSTINHINNDYFDIIPACAALENMPAESAGRIIGTSYQGGYFEEDGGLSFYDRLNLLNTKTRIIWRPEAPVRRDLRLFALMSATSEAELLEASWEWTECEDDLCVQLSANNAIEITLGFDDDGYSYSLVSIDE